MTRRQPEKALKDLGVPEALHEPLTTLLDAVRPGYMLDTELESARDELAAIDGHLRDAGLDLLGHKGVRDLVSVLQGTKTRLAGVQQANLAQKDELRRLQGIEQGLERVLSDLKVDKKGVPGLWRLACWYEDLRDREPSFAEVNKVLIEAGVPVGLDGVEELVNYRDWAKGVMKGIDGALDDAGIQGKGLSGVQALIEDHRRFVGGIAEIARTDIELDEQQECEVQALALERDAEWIRHKLKQGERALELLGEISGLLAQVEHPGSILDKVRALVDAQKDREGLRAAPCHMSVTHLPHITHVWQDSVFGQARCEGWSPHMSAAKVKPVQVCARLDQSETDEHPSHSWLGGMWLWCPGHRPVKMCTWPRTKAHQPHPYQEADQNWFRCPGRENNIENVVKIGECGLTQGKSAFHRPHTYETRDGATKHCSGW